MNPFIPVINKSCWDAPHRTTFYYRLICSNAANIIFEIDDDTFPPLIFVVPKDNPKLSWIQFSKVRTYDTQSDVGVKKKLTLKFLGF